MTIACCYVSPEGVVLGADSTSTYFTANGPHYFNHAQKIFEIGQHSTLGVVTWGLAGLGVLSYRGLFAALSDDFQATPPKSVAEAVDRWIDLFWPHYCASDIFLLFQALRSKRPHDPADAANPANRTLEEETALPNIAQNAVVGFCIGGYLLPTREPAAFEVTFAPDAPKPSPVLIATSLYRFWGAPNLTQRLLLGCDDNLAAAILKSPHWSGTLVDLQELVYKHELAHPIVPIRDAIDFLHVCMASTIKALKFSQFSQICGGPIELAVITADRPFRWVRHKEWDSAISEGGRS